MTAVQHVLRFTHRDWRSGELTLLLAALIIAVASLAAVGFFVDRLRVALDLQATQLLGADLVVRSQRTIPDEYTEKAASLGLTTAQTVSFPSMVSYEGAPRLASVKAFSERYPLRGELRVVATDGALDRAAETMPVSGQAWVDPQLATAINANPGSALQLGDVQFTLTELIALEPDRGGGFASLAPRILIPLEDLEATGLVQVGSRVTYRLMVAGEPGPVAEYTDWVGEQLTPVQRLETAREGRPQLEVTLDRAEQFLSLVALLSALIAAVAVALAARRFAQRHLDACAVVKAIGMTQPLLMKVLVGELLLVALVAGAVGALLGWALHFGLAWSIAPLVGIPLPQPTLWPAFQAMLASLVLLLGFGAFPFVRLAGVPPLRVLRRDLGGASASVWLGGVIAVACFAGLLFWLSNDKRLAAFALGGFFIGAIVFSVCAFVLVWLVGKARKMPLIARSPIIRLALASWSRRRASAVSQTVALSVGLMALILLTVTRTDLIEGWQRATPADAPNRFVVNIQPDQIEPVGQILSDSGVEQPGLYPIVRGRLIEVNGEPAKAPDDSPEEGQADRTLDRELNLSFMEDLPGHNELIEGKWFDPAAMEVSVEQGVFDSLGLAMGDALTFDVGGEQVTATITSIRKVAWDSMQLNFFMILTPAALGDMPQSWVTAFNQPDDVGIDRSLLKAHPNLTVFDTGLILRQIQRLLGQVVQAVQFLFLLTLAAGITVLYGALATSRDERTKEAGLMRALGASRRQLGAAQFWELALSGGLSGGLAAAGALVTGAVLADRVFQFELATRWEILPGGIIAGALIAVIAGWMGLRPVLNSPPLATLRSA
ncbi:MAG: ABC transporter permease [Burkholderiaceae bacterium]